MQRTIFCDIIIPKYSHHQLFCYSRRRQMRWEDGKYDHERRAGKMEVGITGMF